MTSPDRRQPPPATCADLTLDVRSLRARVEFDDGVPVPLLLVTDGTTSVRIGADHAGPTVRDLIPLGRLVASALRFQTVCNRYVRSQRRPAPTPWPDDGTAGQRP